MLKRFLLFFLGLGFCVSGYARVLIFTYAYNRPDFIEIQHKTLQRFFLDDYEFIVFSDAQKEPEISLINETCVRLNIRCIPIPQEIHRMPYLHRFEGEDLNAPAVRNSNAVQYSLNLMGYAHDDIVMLVDSDLFLVKPFRAHRFMEGYGIAGLGQQRANVNYLWIGIALLDMRMLPNKASLNFNCGRVNGVNVDAGGYAHYYLKHNPQVNVRSLGYFATESFTHLFCDDTTGLCRDYTDWLVAEGFNAHQINFLKTARDLEFFENKTFLHYRGGTNWNQRDEGYHQRKTQALNEYVNAILSENS